MKFPFLMLLSLLPCIAPAQAHEGHDHGDGAAASAPALASTAPRFAARTEAFELVGVLAGDVFLLYLDRAADNLPLDQAEIELESGAYKARAERSAAAVYKLKAGPLATPGRHALTFSVSAGNESDLIAVGFEHAPAAPATGTAPSAVPAWRTGLAALLLAGLGAVALLLLRRWRRK